MECSRKHSFSELCKFAVNRLWIWTLSCRMTSKSIKSMRRRSMVLQKDNAELFNTIQAHQNREEAKQPSQEAPPSLDKVQPVRFLNTPHCRMKLFDVWYYALPCGSKTSQQERNFSSVRLCKMRMICNCRQISSLETIDIILTPMVLDKSGLPTIQVLPKSLHTCVVSCISEKRLEAKVFKMSLKAQ